MLCIHSLYSGSGYSAEQAQMHKDNGDMLPQQPAYIFTILVPSRALPCFQNRPVFHPKESYECVLLFFFFNTTGVVEGLLLIKVSDMSDISKKCISCLPGNRLVTKGTVWRRKGLQVCLYDKEDGCSRVLNGRGFR